MPSFAAVAVFIVVRLVIAVPLLTAVALVRRGDHVHRVPVSPAVLLFIAVRLVIAVPLLTAVAPCSPRWPSSLRVAPLRRGDPPHRSGAWSNRREILDSRLSPPIRGGRSKIRCRLA
jgi:hypothetical protein